MSKPVIGFIGLGLMGGNMAENLQNKGYELIVMDLNKDAVAACVSRGAKTASTAKELAQGADIIMSAPCASSFAVLAVFAPLLTHAATASLFKSITISS